jgi:AbiTii
LATSLIDELQLDASNAAVSVSGLLRKALMVAAKLELSDVPEWINKELSGYSNGDSLPTYRVLYGAVKAKSLRGWVPVQFPTNDLQEMISRQFVHDSVSEIEALTKRDGHLVHGFPPEAQHLLQNLFQYETEFMCFLERARFDGILGEIRNQVLRWAIALDKAGIRGEGLSFTNAEKEKAHSMVFHADNGSITIGVVGDVAGQANVATGEPAASRSTIFRNSWPRSEPTSPICTYRRRRSRNS